MLDFLFLFYIFFFFFRIFYLGGGFFVRFRQARAEKANNKLVDSISWLSLEHPPRVIKSIV